MRLGAFVSASLVAGQAAANPTTHAKTGVLRTGCRDQPRSLDRIAKALAEARATGQKTTRERIRNLQRRFGDVHPPARAWVALTESAADQKTARAARRWLVNPEPEWPRACGGWQVALPDGRHAIAVIAAEALATVEPIPRRVRPGQWLRVSAELRVRATSARVLTLDPSGQVRTAPSSFDGARVRSNLQLFRPGHNEIQIVCDTTGGPRPVLDARVLVEGSADSGRPAATRPTTAREPKPIATEDALIGRINHLRRASGATTLLRDRELGALAGRHARRMARARRVAHDVGQGTADVRAAAVGIESRFIGENVARGNELTDTARGLETSASHRANLLDARFRRIGVGSARDADGRIYVCEIFAD